MRAHPSALYSSLHSPKWQASTTWWHTITLKCCPYYWPFMSGILWSPSQKGHLYISGIFCLNKMLNNNQITGNSTYLNCNQHSPDPKTIWTGFYWTLFDWLLMMLYDHWFGKLFVPRGFFHITFIGIPILKIESSHNCIINIMGIPRHGRWFLYLNMDQ